MHVVVHYVVPSSEVLGVDDVFPGICDSNVNHIDVLELRSYGYFFVSPQADLKLYVKIGGQVETVPCYSNLWGISLVYGIVREEDFFSRCCRSFCN